MPLEGIVATKSTLIAKAIEEHPREAEHALASIQAGVPVPFTVDSMVAAATATGKTLTEVWIAQLTFFKQLERFANALRGQGVAVGDAKPKPVTDVDDQKLALFALQAKVRRCRIRVNNRFKGTGHLVGPSLVLTAWHVVAVKEPGQEQEPVPKIEVRLDDGTILPARVPPTWASFCTDDEFRQIGPTDDTQVAPDRSDAVILALTRPAAVHLGYARVPEAPPDGVTETSIIVAHYPKGADRGYGVGTMMEIPNLTARWSHNVVTDEGSSGGACFDANLDLWGLHQGRFGGEGRLVPVARFLDQLRELVMHDVAPDALWSLNGSVDGTLVIGRQAFFEGVAAAGEADTPVRGVRIKRTDIKAGDTGLAFSYDILVQLLARRGPEHRVVRILFDDLVADLGVDIESRLMAAGIQVPPAAAEPGVAPGQAALEGASRDRADRLAKAINTQAETLGATVWFFFDNPAVALSEPTRLFFEAFVASALAEPRLRLVIAGFETLPLAGNEFQASPLPGAAEPLGLFVEYLGPFRRGDLLDFLSRAAEALRLAPAPGVIEEIATTALKKLKHSNGDYARSLLPPVTDKLRARLRDLMP